MPRRRINGIELYYESSGEGEPVVLVHGSWTDHSTWRFTVPGLMDHQVVVYDRRGHSRSERPPAGGGRRADEDDLAALVETLRLAPAHLVANSYGASIALGLAARRPELVRSVAAHEPPLLAVAAPGTGLEDVARRVVGTCEEVVADLQRGDLERGAARFMEQVALGPGAWLALPEEQRRVIVANADTFVTMLDDAGWSAVPVPPGRSGAVLLTDGDDSPPWLGQIVAALADAPYRHAARHTFSGAGHVPHLTHAADYVATVRRFLAAPSPSPAGSPARHIVGCDLTPFGRGRPIGAPGRRGLP